jgi:hypothetical protein
MPDNITCQRGTVKWVNCLLKQHSKVVHLHKPLTYLHITKYNFKNCVSSIQEIENNQSDVDEPLYDES